MNSTEKALVLMLAPALVRWVFVEIRNILNKNTRLDALDGVADAAKNAVQSVVAVLGQNAPAAEIQKAAVAAAKASLLRDSPEIFQSLEASADVLLAGHVARAITAPGGATVNMP